VRKFSLALVVALVLISSLSASAQTAPQELVAQVKRAVVIVTTYDQNSNALQQGSGFFISSDRIVTNFHVVDSAKQIRIRTFSDETVPVESIVAADSQADLAILQLGAPCHDTTSLQVADITPAEGDSLVVVSNPKGSTWKVTAGQVAATWNFEHLGSRMQITASLKPGSSGGPVVNLQGYLIGIAVMHTGSADDLDFAVPAERLKDLQANVSPTRSSSPAHRN
jgi:S1-C subfamily serine protease